MLVFQGNAGKDLQWEMRVKPVLRSTELMTAQIEKSSDDNKWEKTQVVVICALGDNPQDSVQNYLTSMEGWDKLQNLYAGITMIKS